MKNLLFMVNFPNGRCVAKLFRICKYQSVKSDRRRQDILDQAWIESALVVGKVWYLLSFDPELIVFTVV